LQTPAPARQWHLRGSDCRTYQLRAEVPPPLAEEQLPPRLTT
jgi:hypothetical protein